MKNYYEILQLKENASKEEIQKQYEKLSKEFDPKNNKGMEGFFKDELERVNDAYKKIITKIEKIEKIKQEELIKKEEEEKKATEELKENDFTNNHYNYMPKDETNTDSYFEPEESNNDQKNINTEDHNNNLIWNIPGVDIIASSARFLGIILIILGVIQVIDLAYTYEEFEDTYKYLKDDNDRPKFYFIFLYFALVAAFFFKVGSGLTNFAKNFKAFNLSKDNNLLTLSMTSLSQTLKSAFQLILAIILFCGILIFSYNPEKKRKTHGVTLKWVVSNTPFTAGVVKYITEKEEKYYKKKRNERGY